MDQTIHGGAAHFLPNDPVDGVDPDETDMQRAADEKNRGWPFDPVAPVREASQLFPNSPGVTLDRQRHCYVGCIQMRRNTPALSWWVPADFARQCGGAALGQRTLQEAGGDTFADVYGALMSFDISQTCEQICSSNPTNR